MNTHMAFQIIFLEKFSTSGFACIRFYIRILSHGRFKIAIVVDLLRSHMSFQITLLSKCLTTILTIERLLVIMNTHMSFYIALLMKCLTSSFTIESFRLSMFKKMGFQKIIILICPSTELSYVRFLFDLGSSIIF